MSNIYEKRAQIAKLKDKSIDYIMNEGYRILGNPLAMIDTSYNLLCYTENIVTDDPLWNELVKHGTFSHESVDFFQSEGFIEIFAESETVAVLTSPRLKYDRMNGKLFDKDNVQLGDISVVACHKPFEDGDKELFEFLCEIASVSLQNSALYKEIDRVYNESLINNLIEDGILRPHAMIADLYEGLKANLYLCVIEISRYENTVSHLAYFRDLLRKIQPQYTYFVHLNNVIAIISTDAPALSVKKDLAELNDFFNKYKIYAGISGKFQDLNEIKKYYGEALNALNYGIKSLRNQNIFKFDNYRAEYLLNCAASYSYGTVSHEIISRLQEYDEQNNTDLIRILYYYLSYGANASAAASAAGLSTDEFSALLATLSKEFEIDLTDGDMLTNLLLTIKQIENAGG